MALSYGSPGRLTPGVLSPEVPPTPPSKWTCPQPPFSQALSEWQWEFWVTTECSQLPKVFPKRLAWEIVPVTLLSLGQSWHEERRGGKSHRTLHGPLFPKAVSAGDCLGSFLLPVAHVTKCHKGRGRHRIFILSQPEAKVGLAGPQSRYGQGSCLLEARREAPLLLQFPEASSLLRERPRDPALVITPPPADSTSCISFSKDPMTTLGSTWVTRYNLPIPTSLS